MDLYQGHQQEQDDYANTLHSLFVVLMMILILVNFVSVREIVRVHVDTSNSFGSRHGKRDGLVDMCLQRSTNPDMNIGDALVLMMPLP